MNDENSDPNNAKYDYGTRDPMRQKTFKIKSYDFDSEGSPKVRYTGSYSDNAMDDPANINEWDSAGEKDASPEQLDALYNMLTKEAKVSDDEIRAGITLTQVGLRTICHRLGVDSGHVQTLLNHLTSRERRDEETLNEFVDTGQPRYVAEHDFLGNVSVRDTISGESQYFAGSAAMEIMKAIDGYQPGSSVEQQALSHFMKDEDEGLDSDGDEGLAEEEAPTDSTNQPYEFTDPSYFDTVKKKSKVDEGEVIPNKPNEFNAEMNNDSGSYNFPWKLGNMIGTGTATYKGSGDGQVDIDVVSVRDEYGDEIEHPKHLDNFKQQAIKFIPEA